MFNFLRSGARPARPSLSDIIEKVASEQMVLVDVRELGELRASGKARGALHIPLSLLAMRADPRSPDHVKALRPDLPVAVYCASGGRSGMAAQVLARLGYQDVVNIGGLGDWVSGGGAVERV